MKKTIKKALVIISIFITTLSILSLFPLHSTYADDAESSNCRYFLGLKSWDCNTQLSGNVSEEDLKNSIWTIASNIFEDLTVIAAYLIIGYVIYGGYQYTFSRGDPGKVANGKKTITQGFIGLAIVLTANLILSTIRFALGKASLASDCITQSCVEPDEALISSIHWVIAIAGIVAAIFVVYGGISYITSAGDPGKAEQAKKTILYAVIGLVIVALAEIITAFVSGAIRDAANNTNSSYLIPSHQTTISKEVHENNIN
ncbi:hypothetical protein IJG89_00210 [Candidatus Saccharibacteria bacterium]|nr:hypothetical protein [Candidatus Saccharibacteria bacterium]